MSSYVICVFLVFFLISSTEGPMKLGRLLLIALLAAQAAPVSHAYDIRSGKKSPTADVVLLASAPATLYDDYHACLDAAQDLRKLALVWFYDPQATAENERFQRDVLDRQSVSNLIQQHFVAIRLPTPACVPSGGD